MWKLLWAKTWSQWTLATRTWQRELLILRVTQVRTVKNHYFCLFSECSLQISMNYWVCPNRIFLEPRESWMMFWVRISKNLLAVVYNGHCMGRNNTYHYRVIQQRIQGCLTVFNMKRAAVAVTIYKVAMSSNARYYEVHLCPTFYTYKSFIRFNSV